MTTNSVSERPTENWADVLDGLDPASPLRAVIEGSWGRCRAAGLDPAEAPLHRVPATELARRLEASSDLLEAAGRHLDWISGIVSPSPHVVYVTDQDGIVLLSVGNDPTLRSGAGLDPGYDWSEQRMGTNGAGTALVTRRAEAVIGPEHYVEAFRECTCTAAPILGPGGELIGALDITTFESGGIGERLMLASYAARAIQHDIEYRRELQRTAAVTRVALACLTSAGKPSEGLTKLPDLLVPGLCDWTVLQLPERRGLPHVVTAHRDPEDAARLAAAWRDGRVAGAWRDHPMRRATEAGETLLDRELSQVDLARVAFGIDAAPSSSVSGAGSILCVPLPGVRESEGALLLGAGPGRRAFSSGDVEVAEELGTIVGLALENAELELERDRQAEAAQRAARKVRFQAELLDVVEQAVIATDLSGAIVYWNRFAERLYGWAADEVLGRQIAEITPADEAVAQAGEILERLARGESWSGRFRVRRRDGSDFLAHVCDSPVYDAGGAVVGYVGVSYDCTAEEALVASERAARLEAERRAAEAEDGRRTLEALLEHVPAGVTIATAPDVGILHVSRYTEKKLGRPLEVLRVDAGVSERARAWGILRADGTPATDEELPLTRAVRGGESVRNEEWLIERSGHSRRNVTVSAGPIRGSDGAILGGVEAWHDVTALKRAERTAQASEARLQELYEAAEAAASAREEVLAIVSHDLRNPLGVIRTAAEVLTRGDPVAERRVAQLGLIQRSAETMAKLIEDLLDASRIQAGALQVHPAPIAPGAVVERAILLSEPLCQAKDVHLRGEIRTGEPILGDRDRLVQILDNLVGNALQHSEPGGEITVSVSFAAGEVRFSVADQGPGIPPEELAHLFERFWQGRRAERSGAGLGLTICQGLVEAHGGRIWVDTTVERGTTIHFTVPTAARG